MEDELESEFTELTPEYLEQVAKNKVKHRKQKSKRENDAKEQTTGKGSTGSESDDVIQQPDKTLGDGLVLPPYYGKCPEDLFGKPLADLDPYYKEKGIPTFCVATDRFSSVYVYRFSADDSCFLLSPFNPLRRLAIRVVVNQFFDYFIMLTIMANCVFLAMDDEVVESEYVFTVIYTIEIIMKMIARGIIFHEFSYLRDAWNWLDFVVVITSWITIGITLTTQGQTHFNLSALRTFRVVRALKSFTIVPGLKTIVNALLTSIKPLAEVMVIMLFLLVVISLIALQAYQGVLLRRCVRYNSSLYLLPADERNTYIQNPDNWNPVDGELVVCGNGTSSGLCPDGYICMQDVGSNPNHGYTNFDNFGWALLTSFQLFTLDFWENVYNMIIRAEGPTNILFFFVCVIFGPFYLLNLLLAVVAMAYSKEEKAQAKRREMIERAKINALRKKKRLRRIKERQKQKQLEEEQAQALGSAVQNGADDNISNGPDTFNQSECMQPLQESSTPTRNQIHSTHSVSIRMEDDDSAKSLSNSRRSEKPFKKDMSLDSSESENSNVPEWKKWIYDQYESIHGLCCSWSCPTPFYSFQASLLKIVRHKFFDGFIALCIVANTLFLALDHHEIDPNFENVLNIGNYVFTGLFVAEAALKIVAMGVLRYFANHWNKFDFIIVVISLVEFGIPSSTGALSVLRTLRLMRVFRLARIWTTMRKLMAIILESISAVFYLTIVLFMVLFIFAVVGKQIFGSQYASSSSKFDDGFVPRWNFVDFYHSFLLAWRVMCGEWIEPLQTCMFVTDSPSCIALFLPMTIVGNFLVLNLFTAILLQAFQVDKINNKDKEKKEKTSKKVEKVWKMMKTSQKKSEDQRNADMSKSDENIEDKETRKMKEEDVEKKEAAAKRSMSMAHIFALTHASVKKRSPVLRRPSSVDENSSTRATVDTKTTSDKRATFKKQDKIRDDDEELFGNNVPKSENDAAFAENNDSTKKVTWHVGSNCKVHPKNDDIVTTEDEPDEPDDNQSDTSSGTSCFCCCRRKIESTVESAPVSKGTDSDQQDEEAQEEKETNNTPPRCFPNCCKFNVDHDSYIFNAWIQFRTVFYRIVKHRFFEWFILLIILASTVSLALEDVNLKNNPDLEAVLNILEYVFTCIFTLEMILKWIGIGWKKYFTNWWCIIDFVIVVISWIGIGASAMGEVESLKALRTLRALRPLRAVSRWEGMKVVVNALVFCIPSIANVLCVCLLLWLVFSIIGVQLFKGQFSRCIDASGEIVDHMIVHNRTECLENSNYNWTTPMINFDNVAIGMIALFQVATFEGWMEVMSDASDAVGVYQQPRRGANELSYIFFFIFVLIGAFFILNLIVGVIIESFQLLRKKNEASSTIEAFLTDNQMDFYKTMRTMLNRKPKKAIPPPKHPFQVKIFKIVTHSKFEVTVFGVIVLNMISLSMEHYQMSETWTTVLKYVDIVFLVVFLAEAALKIIGLRSHYFRDPFNVFDFVVIILSLAGLILEELLTFMVSPTLLRVVRVFRVFRVLRVIRAARGIRRLILTLMISLPALFNIAVLLGVFMVIFAILGMSFFMDVKLRGALNDLVNFRTFANSILLLFRLMTSAGWNDVLDPLMDETDCEANECGKYYYAIVYFVFYIFLVFLVIVNMYIAIILENFDDMFEQEEAGLSQDDFEFFYVVWARYDPKATQFVPVADLTNLLHNLHPPFQLAKPNEIKIAALDLPIVRRDQVHCLDVLIALVKRIIGEVEFPSQMRDDADSRMQKTFPNRHALRYDDTTLTLRQRTKAARIIQTAWRGFNKERRRDGRNNDLLATSFRPASTLQFHAADVVARMSEKTKTEDAAVKPVVKTESIELTDLNEHQSPHSNEKQSPAAVKSKKHPSTTVQPKVTEEDKPLDLQDASSTSRRMMNDTGFENLSSPEESSALIIENKHASKNKSDSNDKLMPPNDISYSSTAKSENSSPSNNTDNKESTATEDRTGKKSPNPRVPRQLPVPSVGKELKINPRTGQIKKKSNASKEDENSNVTTPLDQQSMVIVNKNSTA